MGYFLGVDSGGSKTECWLGDEDRVLARAMGGSIKLTRVGEDVAEARVQEMLAELTRHSGVEMNEVAATCVGMAGYSIPELREWAVRVFRKRMGGALEICGDEEIGLDAAFRGGPGILVIAGTGAIVVGRCADGGKFTAGGWGPAIGDEGSGYWIGREAVRKIFRAYDEGVPTMLLEGISRAWGAANLGEVVGRANSRPGPDFAALVPVVVECADAGDVLAERLLSKAGNELGKQVAMVWAKMREACRGQSQVAFTGSVIGKIERVRARMRERLAEECPGLVVLEPAVNAVEGALWRARQAGEQSYGEPGGSGEADGC